MAVLELPAASKEYLYVRGIAAFDADSPDHSTDPTTLPVQFAIVARGSEPQEPDWQDGEWVNTTTARILTGTGGDIAPAAGRDAIWMRITGAVEQPVRQVGLIDVQ